MPQKPETIFRKKVRERLELIPNSFWESIQQKTICGTPDILGCINGVFVALELKSRQGRLTPLQEYKLSQIRTAGGIGLCVHPMNLEEVLLSLKNISKGAV